MAPVLYFDHAKKPFRVCIPAAILAKIVRVLEVGPAGDHIVPAGSEEYVAATIAPYVSLADLRIICCGVGGGTVLIAAIDTHAAALGGGAAASWERIAARTEFSHHRFMRRMWPVAADSNLLWRRDAVAIGIIAGLYPDEIENGDPAATVPRRDAPTAQGHARAAHMLRIRTETNYGEWVPSATYDPRIPMLYDIYAALGAGAKFAARILEDPFNFHHIFTIPTAIATAPARSMSYAIYIMLKEEWDAADRAILDGPGFRALPHFAGDPTNGPYMADVSAQCDIYPGAGVVGHLAGPRRFTSQLEFQARLNIMCRGALDGIDFAAHDAFVTGSVLVPCIATCPLEAEFKTFDEFAGYAYAGADMDIGIFAPSNAAYLAAVTALSAAIAKNVGVADLRLSNRRTAKGEKKIADGPELCRPIDFFHVMRNPRNVVSKYHLNCVRFWWDGREIRGLISGVCAMLTGVNLWYNWFSNNKDPIDIVIKYMKRGYATLLNRGEIDIMRRYAEAKKIVIPRISGKISGGHSMFGIRAAADDVIVLWCAGVAPIAANGRVIPPGRR